MLVWDLPNQSPSPSTLPQFLNSPHLVWQSVLMEISWVFLAPLSSPLSALVVFTWSFPAIMAQMLQMKLVHDHSLSCVATSASQCSPTPVGTRPCTIGTCKFYLKMSGRLCFVLFFYHVFFLKNLIYFFGYKLFKCIYLIRPLIRLTIL